MDLDVEDVTLENFGDIHKIIMSYTLFESYLFRELGWNFRSMLDLFSSFCSLMLGIGFILWHVLTFQQNITDAMFQAAVMCHSFCFIVRIITIIIYRHEFVALTSVNFRDFNANQQRPNSSLSILKESYVYLKKLNRFMKGHWLIFAGCFYILPAIFSKSFLGLLEGSNGLEEVIRALPTTFPEEATDSITKHIISWAYHIIFGLVFVMLWATLDVLCFGVTMLLKNQYQILRDSLLWYHGNTADCKEPLKLKEFVQDHVKLLRMIKMLRDILSPIVGAQMLQTIFITAFATFEAAKPTADSGNQLIANFVAYSILSLLELLAFCWQSHIANQASESLGIVIYHASFNQSNGEDTTDWFLPLMMSQKTIKYKALGLVEINMETFLSVLQASYSYYTLMQAKT